MKIFTVKNLQNGKLLAVGKCLSQHQRELHTGMWPEEGVSGGTRLGSLSLQELFSGRGATAIRKIRKLGD